MLANLEFIDARPVPGSWEEDASRDIMNTSRSLSKTCNFTVYHAIVRQILQLPFEVIHKNQPQYIPPFRFSKPGPRS